jgi:hypothetical protein
MQIPDHLQSEALAALDAIVQDAAAPAEERLQAARVILLAHGRKLAVGGAIHHRAVSYLAGVVAGGSRPEQLFAAEVLLSMG